VTAVAQTPCLDLAHQANEQEALLLVELLRSSRLALLYAEAGSDKTGLLRHGLIPLLCRRAGDRFGPAAVRPLGVVVPFPDRRGRSSAYVSKRRREIVFYFDHWTDTPLVSLKKALYEAVAADLAGRAKATAHLGEILEDLSQRFDAHFIVLLDRVEDLLQASWNDAPIVQFANELAEAINQPQLAANFLISLAEEARPRLAGLRARIRGFDDSSLRLAAPRDVSPAGVTTRHQEAVDPACVEPLPVLAETVKVPDRDLPPALQAALGSQIRTPAKRKLKRPPLPRVEVKTEAVYTMIESALVRIAMGKAAPAQPPAATRAPEGSRSIKQRPA
jgi:hypothetical protein